MRNAGFQASQVHKKARQIRSWFFAWDEKCPSCEGSMENPTPVELLPAYIKYLEVGYVASGLVHFYYFDYCTTHFLFVSIFLICFAFLPLLIKSHFVLKQKCLE